MRKEPAMIPVAWRFESPEVCEPWQVKILLFLPPLDMNHRLPLSQMLVTHTMSWDLPCLRSLDRDAFPKGQKHRHQARSRLVFLSDKCETHYTRRSHPSHTWCVSHFQPGFVPCVGQKWAFKPKQQQCLCICHWLATWSQDFCQGLDRRCHATGWPRGWSRKHGPAGWTIDSNKITEEPILHYFGKPPLPINYYNDSVVQY